MLMGQDAGRQRQRRCLKPGSGGMPTLIIVHSLSMEPKPATSRKAKEAQLTQ